MANEESPNPLDKAIEANQRAEEIVDTDVEAAKVWAAISANWLSMVDPRNPEIRKLMRPKRN